MPGERGSDLVSMIEVTVNLKTDDGSWSSATSRVACGPTDDPALLAQAAAQTATGVAQMKRLLPPQRRGLDCPTRLAYRDMSDIGSKRTCGAPVVTPNGFCRRHDPETAPRRDAKGRILPKGGAR